MDKKNKLDAVVIVAGGSGKRMNTKIPKQFIVIQDLPILMHTIKKFYDYNNEIEIILVLPKNQFEYWKSLCDKYDFKIKHKLTEGGKERFFSVKNGLKSVSMKSGIVAIHDGVRPFVSADMIKRGVETATKFKTAIPVIPVTASVILVEENQNKSIDRTKIKLVQTPQIFDIEIIKKAYETDFSPLFTDDASVVETLGQKKYLFDGDIENIKITTKFDLNFADFLISTLNK